MDAGLYKHRISIYREDKTYNEYGESINGEFNKIGSTRAKVVYKNGSRLTENDSTVYDVSYTFYVHRYVDIQEYDRIEYNGKFFMIINIEDSIEFKDKIILTQRVND